MAPGRSLDFNRRTALYRLYGADGSLLYIGIAFNPPTRWYAHACDKGWWPEVTRKEVSHWYESRREAETAERSAILTEMPKYNITGMTAPIIVARKIRPRTSPALIAVLRSAGRAYGRAKREREEARVRLSESIRRAASDGKGPAEITRLIDHEYDVAHVSRIIHGKA